jgi:energy-coupling factor transporter ATP-binding protein EcfA2
MPLAIEEFTAASYRGLRGMALKGLGRVTLLVGQNDSGKTSVLEAMSMMGSPLDPFEWMSLAGRRDPVSIGSRRTIVERLRWLFPQRASDGPHQAFEDGIALSQTGRAPFGSMKASYQLLQSAIETTVTDEDAVLEDEQRRGARIEIEIVPNERFPRPILGPDGEPFKTHVAYTWWEGARFVLERNLDAPMLPTEYITPFDHWFRGLPAKMYSEARLQNGPSPVAEILSAVDPRVVGVEVLSEQSDLPRRAGEAVLYLRDRVAGLLPVEAYGDGMRRILLMALAVSRAQNGVLLIDEIDTAIHVSVLGRVFRWLLDTSASFNVQLVVTTHSLEAVDAILAADVTPEEDIVCFRLERSTDGVHAQRLSENLLKRIRLERGAEIR